MPTVLVVDDSPVDRRLIGGILERSGELTLNYADDGLAALDLMAQAEPDLVLTDMQMPKMDGLKLVKAIGLHHAGVPVILITGKGSEEIAVMALEQGAASYVPKSQLVERLLDTVLNVLTRAQHDRSFERLIRCATRTEFEFELDNDLALVDPLVDVVQQLVLGMRLCDMRSRLRVGVALEQALLNAFFHGNLEMDAEQLQRVRENLVRGEKSDLLEERRADARYGRRKTHVDVRVTPEEARFVIRDEGKGFDVKKLVRPHAAEAMTDEGGRGLVLMQAFMDEVRFNGPGNEVVLLKRKERAPGR